MLITIDQERCVGDGFCVRVCPLRDFALENGKAHTVPPDQFICLECGHCVSVCPKNAISLRGDTSAPIPVAPPVTPREHLERVIHTRRSIRWYLSRQVDTKELHAALDIARYAPTAKNAQLISWIVIRDPEILNTICEHTARWALTDPSRRMVGEAYFKGEDRILRGAPCLVLAHAPSDYALSPQDCGIAVGYLELVLHTMGLGSCWSGYVLNACAAIPELRELLGVGEGRAVYGGLMVGYPGERHRRIPGRKPLDVSYL